MNFQYFRKLTKNKCLEIVLKKEKEADCIFFNLTELSFRKKDHAGFHWFLIIWPLHFEFNIYDSRHWDYDNNKWEERLDLRKPKK